MKIFRYDPNQHGLARWLGAELSAPLMDWLWEQSKPVTVRYVIKYYTPRLRYTTAATTLDRLVGYGMLEKTRTRQRHKVYEFAPCYTREEWEAAQFAAIKASIENTVAVGDDGWGHGGWEA